MGSVKAVSVSCEAVVVRVAGVMGNSAPGHGASEAVMIAPEDTGPHTNQCNVSCARDRG